MRKYCALLEGSYIPYITLMEFDIPFQGLILTFSKVQGG